MNFCLVRTTGKERPTLSSPCKNYDEYEVTYIPWFLPPLVGSTHFSEIMNVNTCVSFRPSFHTTSKSGTDNTAGAKNLRAFSAAFRVAINSAAPTLIKDTRVNAVAEIYILYSADHITRVTLNIEVNALR